MLTKTFQGSTIFNRLHETRQMWQLLKPSKAHNTSLRRAWFFGTFVVTWCRKFSLQISFKKVTLAFANVSHLRYDSFQQTTAYHRKRLRGRAGGTTEWASVSRHDVCFLLRISCRLWGLEERSVGIPVALFLSGYLQWRVDFWDHTAAKPCFVTNSSTNVKFCFSFCEPFSFTI